MGELKFIYAYKFSTGAIIKFTILLDEATLSFIPEAKRDLPEWTNLGCKQCSLCPLDQVRHRHCPIAANLSGVTEKFSDFVSHDRVSVAVIAEERTYSKETTVQMGLSPLLGIIMATSGCPIMDQLKPMVRYHLPFASLEETVFRMVSMHLVSQYLRKQNGKSAEWSLDGLSAIYAQVAQINRDFVERLLGAARNDVNVNALVNLDAFAQMVPLAADKTLKKLAPYYAALLK